MTSKSRREATTAEVEGPESDGHRDELVTEGLSGSATRGRGRRGSRGGRNKKVSPDNAVAVGPAIGAGIDGSGPDNRGDGVTPAPVAKATKKAAKAAKAAPATKATKAAKGAPATKAAKSAKAAPVTKAAKSSPATKATKAAKAAKATKAAKAAKANKAAKAAPATKPVTKTAKAQASRDEEPRGQKAAASTKKAVKAPRAGTSNTSTATTKTTKATKAGKAVRTAEATNHTGSDTRPGAAEALNDPLTFLTFVADHPVGSTFDGTVVSFTSHGAHVDVGGMLCHVPLRGLAVPPPNKARQVLTKGEIRPFVLVSLDPARRRAELALPGVGH